MCHQVLPLFCFFPLLPRGRSIPLPKHSMDVMPYIFNENIFYKKRKRKYCVIS